MPAARVLVGSCLTIGSLWSPLSAGFLSRGCQRALIRGFPAGGLAWTPSTGDVIDCRAAPLSANLRQAAAGAGVRLALPTADRLRRFERRRAATSLRPCAASGLMATPSSCGLRSPPWYSRRWRCSFSNCWLRPYLLSPRRAGGRETRRHVALPSRSISLR